MMRRRHPSRRARAIAMARRSGDRRPSDGSDESDGPAGARQGRPHSRRGAAVLLVLSCTLLMAMMVLAVVSLGVTEKRSAASMTAAMQAESLADQAVALAVSQLRDGTRQLDADGMPMPWTSQPGGLRVHNMDGSLQSFIKLYSAASLSAASVDEIAEDLPVNWDGQPFAFADLNEPAITPDPENPGRLDAAGLRFPIADPRQAAARPEASVEGFAYGLQGTAVAGVVPPGDNPNAQRLPMPVRWLYSLEDGTFGLIQPNGLFLPVVGEGRPSRHNRLTGRIAFWTDDESCKINVNTASEGVHWDTPRCTTHEEIALAAKQPSAGEYQRFPGHPAMVSLSSVLFPHRRFHADGSTSVPRLSGATTAALPPDIAEGLWSLAPVLAGSLENTSHGGRVVPPNLASPLPFPFTPDRTARLASPHDLVWQPESPAGSSSPRVMDPLFVQHPEAATRLARGQFFLTAASSAPEITLFGTPRISVWPIHENVVPGQGLRGAVPRGSAHDYLMALTTTLGGRRYHWQRAAPGDGHFNFFGTGAGKNRELFEYARALTDRPVPGFHRHGMAASFAEKYGPGPADDRDSILVGIFDYIRQTNFNDAGLTSEQQFCVSCPADPQRGFGQVSPLYTGGNAKTRRTDQLTDADLHAAKGAGRMLTVSEVSFVFICRAEVAPDGSVRGNPSSPDAAARLTVPGMREIQMAVIIEGFVPSQGWGEYRPYLALALGGSPAASTGAIGALPDLRLFDQPVGLARPENSHPSQPAPRFAFLKTSDELASRWIPSGGSAGVRFAISDRRLSTAFLFEPVIAGPSVETLDFSGTPASHPMQLALYDTPDHPLLLPGAVDAGPASTADLLQVIPLHVPSIRQTLPCPSLPGDETPADWKERLVQAKLNRRLISSNDVVQSLIPAHGDHRLTAASRTLEPPASGNAVVPAPPVFVPHPLWGNATQAHQLTESTPDAQQSVLGAPAFAAVTGYIPDVPLLPVTAPDFPWRLSLVAGGPAATGSPGASFAEAAHMIASGRLDLGRRGPCLPHLTGDFDNGVAWAADGPYINRPDDGETSGYLAGGVPYFNVAEPRSMHLPDPRPRVWGASRQVPSPVMLGSLPTGVKARVPWQTLLFRPQGEPDPAGWSAEADHYGWSWPRDHLLLDLFWMPVQEPAALSAPAATEGKINLNHRLVPFGHIRRTTALHSLLKAEKLLAIPDAAGLSYKLPPEQPPRHTSFRHFIDADETLAQWDREVFDQGRVFLAASEICEHDLVPEGLSGERDAMRRFWATHRLTGDNSKERPYANLYGRLTTRSNTYRVHFRAESLRAAPPDDQGRIDLASLDVSASIEGSAVVERHLDPENPDLPDAVAALRAGQIPPPLDHFHDWRIRRIDRFLR